MPTSANHRDVMLAHRALVAAKFPAVGAIATFKRIGRGWDSHTYLVNGDWIFQFPRTADVHGLLRRQMVLLNRLNGKLPAAVPFPTFTSKLPLCMGYRWIEGGPVNRASRGCWPERLGTFLRCLHAIPPKASGMPPRTPQAWRADYRATVQNFDQRAGPLLTKAERRAAKTRFSGFLDDDDHFQFAPAIVHRDLGPEHVLVTPKGDLAGVIDWGDATIGDPAIDFAWLLFGKPRAGERALAAYGAASDKQLRNRALFYRQLGPWFEVTYGLDTDQPGFVQSGLAGIRTRLGLPS